MASHAERAATLARAVEASIEGDSSVVAELYTDNVEGSAPALNVSSAAELAVELEDREDAFCDEATLLEQMLLLSGDDDADRVRAARARVRAARGPWGPRRARPGGMS